MSRLVCQYKYLLLILCLASALFPLRGQGLHSVIVNDSVMMIGPDVQSLTEEEIYFNPTYLFVDPSKEYLKLQLIRACACDCDTNQPNRRIGVFSVAKDKQVSFSQGNLQYLPASNVWKFASQQYEYLHNSNKYISPTYRNWVDLFGWSGKDNNAPFGISTSTNNADYAGEFVDWGNNSICGDAPGTWRTMSADEWEFLLEKRKNASNLYGVAKVAGENGLIILPDDWKVPEGIIFKAGLHSSQVNDFSVYQSFTADEWKVMEEAGAVFLHASGYRDGATVEKCNTSGYYWSNTTSNDDDAYRMYFYSYFLGPKDVHSKYRGRSVRLVHDTIVPPPAPCETFEVKGVTFNMMCVEGGTFMMGSNDSSAPSNTRPAHPVTLSDFHIGQTEVTRALWRAVMDTVPGSGTDDMPVGHVTWEECQVFLTKLSEMTGKHFRLPTEAEWEYAARGGNKNKDFIYSGSDYADVVGWINYESNKIMPVAQKRCNQLGIYDMTGNSWEWCQDGGCRSYTTDSVINPIYVGASTGHVIRGGSFRTEPARCTNIARSTYGQNKGDSHISLRLVMDTIVPPPAPCETFEVKGVTFNMMCVEGEKYDYLIGQTEVTRALWKAVMGQISSGSAVTDAPVDNVTWGDCQQFINQLNSLTGLHFRFPTKEEWLYAAKGGTYNKDFLYSGSDNIDEVGWYDGNTPGGVQPVAQLKPNALGIYDMTGNVWEWVLQTSNSAHLYMGGSYAFNSTSCLLGNKGTATSPDHKGSIGLRLVLDTHQYVDLGLSVMWATTNIGAETPEQFGDYFAWGETEPKEVYDWSTYKWCNGTEDNMTKYNATDGLTTLLLEDDAAHVNWGGDWRMATMDEWKELRAYCTWTWETQNGVNGYRVTGPNGNSIFLPASGFHYVNGLSYKNSHGDYWSASRIAGHVNGALHPSFLPDKIYDSSSFRYYGFSIRPVIPTDREILTPATPPKRIGVFSVAADKHVTFSQGNLQYTQSTDTWQFANEQWECIGAGNIKEGALADKIDLFGWSANNTTAPWGISLSTNNSDYAGEFVDWGENIINSDVPNTWRTLTNAEWEYVLNGRDNASQLRCRAQVDHVNGFVFLPDEWVCPDGIELNLEQPTTKVFTRDEWSKMENAGAVFLPAAGRIDNKKLVNFDDHGNYWSSTRINDQWVDYLAFTFSSNKLYVDHQMPIYLGRSVRLVRDTIVPKPEYVDLGLSVKWATFNVGATSPEEYGDYFAWGETEPKETYSWATYKWGTSSNLTKYNTTDGKTILDPEDDAAQVHWGDKWRMPTDAERDELVENCTWTWTTQNSVNGYKVTGPNGNSIFLPAGGYKGSGPDYPVGEDGLYWLGNVYKNSYAYLFTIQHEVTPPSTEGKQGTRCFGFMIRPIYDDRPPKRIGVFSVAADKQVSFSQGNLQYTQSTDEWRFAREQYEYIGAANITDGALADRIDLFGWSANNTTAPFGISTSTNNADYAGEFVDWGTNIIQGDAANTWRTLSKEEWEYLIKGRKNASNLRAAAQVNGVNGMILLPDDWECPEGIDFKAGYHTSKGSEYYAEYQQFTNEQWRELETTGAIFLPAAGMHDGNGIADIQAGGYYWSATDNGDTYAYTLISQSSGAYLTYDNRYDVRSVRLVHDTIVPPPAPCETFKVNGVTFNMMCVEGGIYTMGEGRSDAHQVTLSDYYIGETEVTQAQWKAVMGSIPDGQEHEGDEYPVAFVSLADCRVFVERLSQMTGKFFRIPTEAEWEYAARGGKHSKGYIYAGSDSIDEVAWYKDNMTEYQPHAVKQLKPNELGTYDMTGNLAEWVSDWYAPYNTYPQINPTGAAEPAELEYRNNYRGGCWTFTKDKCESTFRHRFTNRGANGIGLRLVMSDVEPFRAVYLNDTTRFYLRPVKKGTFMMGSKEDDPIVNQNKAAKADELPQHKVTLDSDYWVAEYELTQALWTAVMGTDIYDMQAALTKPSSGPVPAGPNYPMYFVYTKDVLEFTRRLSQMTGLNFRLPTEAEWEFAARGGNLTHGYLYAGSNNVDSVAWYTGSNSGIQIVGQKMPNELGLYDLSGNVLERCIDYLEYHQSYNPNDSINPRGRLLQSGNRAYRGGAHNMHKDSVRVTHRAPQTPTYTSQNVGTRLVVNEEHHFQTFNVGSVWFDMIFVKGGTFMMGAAADDTTAETDEKPQHLVTLSDYYIGQTEVSQWLWRTVMGSNPSTIKDSNKPVNNVTWEECQVFVEKLSQMTGYYFRLPTEAEWEFAARGGNKSKGYKYAGSDNLSDVAWYTNNSSGTTHAFATKLPNELGIYDMSGNVWEWCYDWYGPYSAEAQVDPTGPETGEYHMYRGGGWKHVANTTRVAYRRKTLQGYDPTSLGLRLAMSKNAMIPLPEPDPVPTPGKRIGVFSVAKDKQVSFSQGNLQYIQSKDKWQFAPDQLYITGNRHYQDGALADTIMYFGWSGKNSNAPWGISLSINSTDYEGEFLDWGTNIIGGDTANTWRTTSDEEWNYMLCDRKNADKLHAIARVDTINGLILLPDDWILPEGMHFEPTIEMVESNQYTLSEWSVMENAGAVFMPMSGYFNHKLDNIRKVNVEGYVRSNNLLDGRQVYSVFKTGKLVFSYQGNNTANLFYAFPVRLVRDTIIPQYVDLGLSVKWANYNLGASTPSGYGDYFAWGETEPKDSYMPANYQWSMGSAKTYTKYCTVDSMGYNGFTDGLTTLQPQDDAAQMQKGGHWRMPSDAEWEELIKNCTWTQAEQGGQIGYIATSKINGNSIFIPVAGFRSVGNVVHDYLGAYWSSSLNESKQSCAYGLYINKDENRVGRYSNSRREYGFLIRPVYDENYHAYVDLGLSVKWATTNVGAESAEEFGDYFAWGETEPKEVYDWSTYKWCDSTENNITKYNATDGLKTLLPEDDAATVNWGGQWRMPTKEELAELREQCTWEPATINGVKGAKVTGPNGNSIFIPLGGSYNTFNDQLNSVGNHGWIYSSSKSSADNQAQEMGFSSSGGAQTSCSRCVGLNIRPVVDDKVTVTVVPTTNDATVGLLSVGYTREGNSITVDQGKSVLYLVSNVEGNYLSKGDSLINLTQDTTLYVGLEPFSDGVWEPVDDSLLVHTPNCYISRNNCAFAKYDSWNYYVMPASEGETYRIQTIAGQLAAPWIAVSSLPDFATLTRASKIACSPIRGVVGYLAEEFTVPAGTKYLIFNHRTSSTYPLKVEKKSKYRYGISSQYWEECNGLWGHGGRGHAVQDQSPIQGTIVQGVRLNVGRVGSLNIYKIPSLFGSTEDNFQLVATITATETGLQDIDFPTPIYVGENEYLVFGKPSEITPTLTPMYNTLKYDTFKQNFVHFIGTDKVKKAGSALMVDFY